MIEYKVDNRTFTLSYQALRERHLELCELSDEDFLKALPSAIHLACIIGFLKEIPTYICLRDDGIIHELVHLLDIPADTMHALPLIRQLFKEQLNLAA